MTQVVSLIGSVAVLAAYVATQFKWLEASHIAYAVLNFVGSGILAVIALVERQWGFLLLEGVWSLISLWSTIKILASRRPKAD